MHLGVYRTPQMWHEQAKLLPFPADAAPFVRSWHVKALKGILGSSPLELVEFRKQRLLEIMQMATNLEKEAAEFKATLPNHIKQNLEKKRLLLFKKLRLKVGINGEKLVDNVAKGFDVVGTSFHADLFPTHEVKAVKTEQEFLGESHWRVQQALALTRGTGDQELDEELYHKTQKEKMDGSMQGPFDKKQLDEYFGFGRWVPARRFGLWQSSFGVAEAASYRRLLV